MADNSPEIIALAGNPNVGKSTIFNALTGMKQHTGNWPGKTVLNAQGTCTFHEHCYTFVDIPGCYSLMAHSAEEEVARDFICFQEPDAVIVVCDATCLERNLNLVLQIIESGRPVLLCVNLLDEAARKKIRLDLPQLSSRLHIPVTGTTARSRKGLDELLGALEAMLFPPAAPDTETVATTPAKQSFPLVVYPEYVEEALSHLIPCIKRLYAAHGNETASLPSPRWLAARLLDANENLLSAIKAYLGFDPASEPEITGVLEEIHAVLRNRGISREQLHDDLAAAFVRTAERLCRGIVFYPEEGCDKTDRRLDRIFTSRLTGFPIMLLLLLGIFWITITGANYPSALLADLLFGLEDRLASLAAAAGIPGLLTDVLLHGIYRVIAWVVSVMLPPMAIFFPLFTLLEDFGYLPRVAFNLDRCFKKCSACGKQALTMCMGFGCNAAGVTGCRIIDSPRERLIAIITNNFVPCNGRFPTIISIITLFLIGGAGGFYGSFLGACILVGIIILGVFMTLLVSRLLSTTLLKGVPSSFTLEMPPYRKPQILKVIIRSIVDRTIKVLGRAMVSAAPAGLIIWILANVHLDNQATLLTSLTGFLDPFARALGMDGCILTGFLLGLPANEIVVPIIIMTYMAGGSLIEIEGAQLLQLFTANGWTWITAVSTILFSLMHWPCATTCLTIKKETGSLKWTLLSFLIPTVCGILICFLFTTAARLLFS
ncbi:ferrous iron transport protein B [Lachnospiraceae bacterium NLAE-zl-G231]|nr:ferrous iron transport protein B [Lachnospiraceae bacterium NLAE-zl-G231]